MYLQLTNAINFAYSECSRKTTLTILNKNKWFTLKVKTMQIRHTVDQSLEDIK